jgi:hypothetical protein
MAKEPPFATPHLGGEGSNVMRRSAISKKRVIAVRPELVEPPFDKLRANGTLNLMTLVRGGRVRCSPLPDYVYLLLIRLIKGTAFSKSLFTKWAFLF